MPIWVVKAVWREDEAEASEQWDVRAASVHEAIRDAMAHIRFRPRHVEASLRTAQDSDHGEELVRPGDARRHSDG